MRNKTNSNKKAFLLTVSFFIFLSLIASAEAETGFVSVWDTSATSWGSSNTTQITLPLESSGVYNFVVDWGDGSSSTITTYDSANNTHNYTSAGNYTLNITGTIQGWTFSNGGDRLKILDIQNWGVLNLGNSGGYFYGG